MVVFDLDDGLNDDAAWLQDIEDFCILPNVKDYVIWLILDLIQLMVQIYQLNEAPFLKEWQTLQKLLPSLLLQDLHML